MKLFGFPVICCPICLHTSAGDNLPSVAVFNILSVLSYTVFIDSNDSCSVLIFNMMPADLKTPPAFANVSGIYKILLVINWRSASSGSVISS